MKKIINGKMYNTETATEVGNYWNGLSQRDFNHVNETLYRKKTGEFFLYGEGGPMSRYSESCGNNSWTGGERIIPLSEKEAKKWAEDKISADAYCQIFGEPGE